MSNKERREKDLPNLIITPSKEVKNIFNEQLQINSTYIISDTRFEQIQHRKKNSHKILELEPIKGKNNIIFGDPKIVKRY